MQIIDLIILIYHKEMPYKIMYEGEEYVYNKEFEEYVCCDHDLTPLFSKHNWYGLTILDDKVEILEKEKKEKIKIPEKLPTKTPFDDKEKEEFFLKNRLKINEIIDYLKSKGE